MIDPDNITRQELCRMIDHTLLKPYASEEDLRRLCREARENHFAMVAINSYPVSFCKSLLEGSDVHVGAAISFPLGQTTIGTKCFETTDAINNGADEIDYVANIARAKMHDYGYIRKEMEEIVKICRDRGVTVKVIFENCYLEKEEIASLANIALDVKPDFIKTSTGFGISGAIVEDVMLMKQIVKDKVRVKAAGGIRDWNTCREMIRAGAERIGTSSSIKILEEYEKDHR